MRQEVYVKFAEALYKQRLVKTAAGGSPSKQLLRVLRRAWVKASPKVNADSWGRFDPRRLFVRRHSAALKVRNVGGASGGSGAGTGVGGAYQGGEGNVAVPTYADLGNTTTMRETTRLSPARILAALGLAGAGGGAVMSASGGSKPEQSGLIDYIKANPGLAALLAGGTALAAGGVAAGIASSGRNKKRKKEYEG